jgi:restriction system protein
MVGDRNLIPSSKMMTSHVVDVIREAGGSCTSSEIDIRLQTRLGLSSELCSLPHKEGEKRSEFQYRSAWARSYCKKLGLIDRGTDGKWFTE